MGLSESIKEATSITTRGMFQFACDARDQFKKKNSVARKIFPVPSP